MWIRLPTLPLQRLSVIGGYLYGARGGHLSINSMLDVGANNYPQGYHVNARLFNDTARPLMGELADSNLSVTGRFGYIYYRYSL